MHDVDALIEYAERPRVDGWSLRAALVRYAQPEPARAGAILELIRRTDGALEPFAKLLSESPQLVSIACGDIDEETAENLGADEVTVVALVRVALALDRLGDVLATWASNRSDERPDVEIDAIARSAFVMLGDLGVAHEARPPRRS